MAGVVTRANASTRDATDETLLSSLPKKTAQLTKKKQANMTTLNGTNSTPGFELLLGGEGQGTTLDKVA
jgi:hypothetical protein